MSYIPSTEDVRAAWYGLTQNTESFDRWLYAERERVWNMMSKIERDSERERIIQLLHSDEGRNILVKGGNAFGNAVMLEVLIKGENNE